VTVRKHTYVYSTNSVVLFLLLRPYMRGTASATLQSKSSTFCKSNPYTQKVRPHSRPSRKPRSCYAKTFRPWRSSAEKIQKDISGLSQRSRRDPDLKSVEPDSMSVRSEYDSKTVCFSCSARTWDSKQAIHFEAYMEKMTPCANATCSCLTAPGRLYCSEYCRQAVEQAVERHYCQCEHESAFRDERENIQAFEFRHSLQA